MDGVVHDFMGMVRRYACDLCPSWLKPCECLPYACSVTLALSSLACTRPSSVLLH